MKRVVILFSGGGSNLAALLDDMSGQHPGRAVLALTNRADAGGLEKAAARGVATDVISHKGFADRASFDAVLAARIEAAAPDLICLAGFMRIFTEGFVRRFEDRMINIHPSLLPKYRGLNTHARALQAQETEHGCTVHRVTPELDEGPILGQAKVPVLPGDTPEILAARVLKQEHILYPAVLRRVLAGTPEPLFLSEAGANPSISL